MSQTQKSAKTSAVSEVTKTDFSLWKWIVSLAVPLFIFLVPATESYTPVVKGFLAVTFWGVFSMATEIFPSTLVAALLPVVYILFNVATPQQAFAPWTTSTVWISFGGIIIATILMTSGLAKRIAYFTILKTGGSFSGILIGILLAGVIINPFVPSVMGKMAIIVPIAIGICQALNLEPKSKGASAIMITSLISIATVRIGYLTGDGGIPMMMGIVTDVSGLSVSWSKFAFHNLIPSLIFALISVILVIILLKPEKAMEKRDVILQKYKELGETTKEEKKVAVLLIITIIALTTDSIHGLNSGWIFMIIGGACFLPGVNLLQDKDLSKLNYKILFFISGCMSIGTVASGSGAGKWLGDVLLPFLTGSPLYTTVSAWVLGILLNFTLTPLAALASFTAPITEVCLQTGINPLPVVYSFLQGLEQYILPYEFAGLLFIYSYGYMSLKSVIKVYLPRMVLGLLFIIAIAYPYWKLIGLYN